jgi:hypothetical protein
MAINVGGPAYSASNGTTYIADRYYSGGETSDWGWVGDVINTKDDAIYLDERWGDFQYNIPIANGAYDVVLQFSEMNWTGVGERKIIAAIEGITMLRDYDIYQSVGNGCALDLSFNNTQITDGVLTIQLSASADAGTLSGILVKRRTTTTSSISGTGGDLVAPTTPSGVAYTALTDRSVALKWTASSDNVGVVGYYVYRDGAPVGYVAGQTTTYVDQALKSDTSYSYAVAAVDAAGNQSTSSQALAAKTYVIAGTLTINWTPPAERLSGAPVSTSEIGGYTIRYKLRTATNYTSLNLPAGSIKYTLPRLVGDYVVEMAAFDMAGLYSSYVKVNM